VYRLGERLRLDLDPPGATVEVDTVVSAVIAARAIGLVEAFGAAEGADDLAALAALYAFIVEEARPSWDFVDHRGPIPATVDGFQRLPLPIALTIVDRWVATLPAAAPSDAPSDAELAAVLARPGLAAIREKAQRVRELGLEAPDAE